MTNKIIKSSFYAPCGLYCGACGATDCGGCLSEIIDESIVTCTFRRCTTEKKLEFCCFCDDFPCKELNYWMHDEWPHHWSAKSNLKFIRKYGKEKWLEVQKEEWRCDSCGEPTKWYLQECACGLKLNAWELPEAHRDETGS